MTTRIQRRSGITLVEVLVSTLLVSIVLVSAMNTVGGVFKSRNLAAASQAGPALARNLMSEVLQSAYADPQTPTAPIGRDAGESATPRTAFDDVDDYHGWNALPPVKRDGTSLGFGAGWRRQVSVTFVNPNTLTTSASDTGLKLITVTVTPPTGSPIIMKALRSRLGSVERLPSFDRTFVTASQLELRTSDTATDFVSGTSIKNHGIDQ